MVVDQPLFHRDDNFLLDLAAQFHGDKRRRIIIDHIGNRSKHAHLQQLLDDLGRGFLHAGSQLADGDLIGDLDLDGLLLGDLKLQALHLLALFLAAFGRGGLRVLTLLVLVADLFLLAAAVLKVVSAATSGKIFKLLVVFFDVDRRAASRIDDTLFRHLTRDVRFVLHSAAPSRERLLPFSSPAWERPSAQP